MITNKEFSGFLQALHSDIRLEVIIADMLTEGLSMDNVVIESVSLFKRNYHYDVESCGEIEFGAGRKKKLRFVVNREGIYDQLPEDLFHQVPDTGNATDKDAAIQEIKEHRDLERQSRLFFQPLEHEFYTQRVKLEIEERKFLFETNDTLPGEIFNQLWELPEFLNDLQKTKLGLVMPLIHTLTGNKDLLSFVFESITGDPIEFKETAPQQHSIKRHPILGDARLSTDTVLGGHLKSVQPGVTIVIYITAIEKLADYMPGGKNIVLHEFLCDLFMPLDAEIIFETSFSKDAGTFVMDNDSVFEGRLNYTTII